MNIGTVRREMRFMCTERGCLICLSHTTLGPDGRPRITYQGRSRLLHRLVYEWLDGALPQGLVLDHLCRDKECCEPSHLDPVPQAVNVRRGRLSRLDDRGVCRIHGLLFMRTRGPRRPNGRYCAECRRLSKN